MSNSRFGLRTRSGVITSIIEIFNNIGGLIFKIDSSDSNSYQGTGIEWNDLSGYDNNGELINNPSFEPDNLKSFYFDGTNDYAIFGNSNKLNVGNLITVFSVFQVSSTKNYQVLAAKKGDYINYDAQNGWELANSGGYLRTTLSPSILNSNNIIYNADSLEVDRWYIAAFTYNGTQIKLYLDGQLVGTANASSPSPVLDGTGDLYIGARWEGGFYKGNILYTAIYGKEYTSTEIDTEYSLLKNKISIVPDNLVLHLDASNNLSYPGFGTLFYDLSGSDYHATLGNSPTFDTVSKTFKFNGINQSLIIGPNPTNLFVGSSNYTWSAWLNFGKPINTYREVWYASAGGGSQGFGLTLMTSSSGGNMHDIKVEIYGTLGSRQSKYFTVNTDLYDTWNHWAFTIDQSNYSILVYLNSNLVSSLSYDNWGIVNPFDNYIYFGKHSSEVWWYDGSLGELLIYNRKLNSDEISRNYNLTKYKYKKIDDGLLIHFDSGTYTSYPGTGNTWYDISGNGNHGTLYGLTYDKERNGSLISNGIDNYISTNFIAESPTTVPYTYEISFNIDSLDVGFYGLIGNSTYNSEGFSLGIYSTSYTESNYVVGFQGFNGSTTVFCGFLLSKNTHNVYTITVTINGRIVTMYENGIFKATNTGTVDILKKNEGIKIAGYTQGGWGSAPIRIYNAKVYNKILHPKEITRNWNFIKNRYLRIPIVYDGLKLYLDGENINSNSRSGTTWSDLSGYGNNATLNNGPILSNQNSGAIKFDGVNDYGIVPHSSNLNFGTGDFTVMMWVNGIRSYPGGTKTLIRKGSLFNNGSPGWSISYAGSPQELYIIVSGPSSRNEYLIPGLSGGWDGYKLIGIQRKSSVLYFINDAIVTFLVATDGKDVNNTDPIEISYSSVYGSYLKSEIGMVAAYNYALTTDEITLNYNVTKNKYKDKTSVSSGLQLNLDAAKKASYSGTGTTWIDSVAANNATISGGFTFSTSNQGGLVFDGIDGKADFYSPNLTNVATVEMWAKISSVNGKMMFGFDRYSVYSLDGALGFNTANSDLYGLTSSLVTQLSLYDNWHHYVFEMRSDVSYNNNKIYIDGTLIPISQISGAESIGSRNFNSGNGSISTWRYTSGYFMNQTVSLFRIYNRILTLSEVQQNFNATKQRYL
jgi:hypothetical protein